jgi:hypothetical protein
MNWKTFVCLASLVFLFSGPGARSQNPKKNIAPQFRFKLFLEPVEVDRKADALQKLLAERYNEVVAEFKQFTASSDMFDLLQRSLQATLEFKESPQTRLALLKTLLAQTRHYERFKEQEQDHLRSVSPGLEKHTFNFLHKIRAFRLEAEIHILRTEMELKSKQGKNK